ncbi:Arp Ankyrin repeat, partial [Pyrenophora tritici-repentis]
MAYIGITEMLVKEVANINAKNQGWMALHLAAERGLKDMVEALVENGVSVNKSMNEGWTALHLAAGRGHKEVVRVLVEKGADVDMKNMEGCSALHIAAEKGYEEVVKVLVEAGAEIHTKDTRGLTPAKIAEEKGFKEVARELEASTQRHKGTYDRNGRSNSGLFNNSDDSSVQKNTIAIPTRVFPRNSPFPRVPAESDQFVPTFTNNTITIPCHHIRIGDILILQGRPCQVIRITTSQTGQHRYLGVDLFTKQLHEESSFISNPAPSVVVQNMLGPFFKQYRVLDIREDGRVVAMTETGDIKQGLPILDQSGLASRLTESFANGRSSVRVLIIDYNGLEMVVDYK